ncbi:hypothetical protein K491DRAFT_712904 [Lophiostoma macrostomum CBS 122681]|uniref:Uncharacterized protein n=1 Tax=Lophiostoma macrostomum CBS 122681 TaxID=1314788 RepID=A0A6A6TJM3_9PLEO|nr:hypothetical protein K491DRAFT_712904 [Lophiostoma macrostomum CBS 122681]
MSFDNDTNAVQPQEEHSGTKQDHEMASPGINDTLPISINTEESSPTLRNVGGQCSETFGLHADFAQGNTMPSYPGLFQDNPANGVHDYGFPNEHGTLPMSSDEHTQIYPPLMMPPMEPSNDHVSASSSNGEYVHGYYQHALPTDGPQLGLAVPPQTTASFPFARDAPAADPDIKSKIFVPSWPTGFFSLDEFNLGWNDHMQTSAWRNRVTVGPTVNPQCDPTIQVVEANSGFFLRQIVLAMFNQIKTHDQKQSAQSKQFLQGGIDVVSNPDIEATAHEIFYQLMDRCKNGFRGHGLNNDAAKPIAGLEADRDGSCQERVQNVIDALATSKCVCRDVYTETNKIKLLVNAPIAYRKSKSRNEKNNGAKKNERQDLLDIKRKVEAEEATQTKVVPGQHQTAVHPQVVQYTAPQQVAMAPMHGGYGNGMAQGQIQPSSDFVAPYASASPLQGFPAHYGTPMHMNMGPVAPSPNAVGMYPNALQDGGNAHYQQEPPVFNNLGGAQARHKRAQPAGFADRPGRKMQRTALLKGLRIPISKPPTSPDNKE